MKKLNFLAVLLAASLLTSCSTKEIEDEIGLEQDLETHIQSNCPSVYEGLGQGPIPPPPPCF